jgi:glycosyltransferase involved in cell wall biosynthesis
MTLVFVGPDPASPHIAHAGGQLTATSGFAAFAAEQGVDIAWVDTAQSNFPVPPLRTRIARAAGRIIRFGRLIASRDSTAAILFAGAGASFVERSSMALIARLAGKPSLLMIRSGHFQTQYRRSPAMRAILRAFLRLPSRIGVQGESWLPIMREAGVAPARIAVVPNWLGRPPRAARVRVLSPGEPLRLLFAGWLTSHKGVPELVEAMRDLARAGANVVLTLVGGGTLLDEVRAAATEPELQGRLEVTGWLERDDLEARFDEAHALVLPSHAEGFPNVVMEALASGLPVIATAVGAIPDSVRHGANGLIIPIGDARAIAAAVRHYLQTPGLIEQHSTVALATARSRHDRDTNCRALMAALSATRDPGARSG